jgi:hypothetical protein
MGVESCGEILDADTPLPKSSGRFPAMSRRAFHVLLGLILVACVICPFVEFAIGWNDTIFTTGYDTESSVAVIMLLLELVLALATVIASFLPDVQVTAPLVIRQCPPKSEFGIVILLPDPSLLVPLRI